jgi:inosose dehydratase
MTPTPVLARLAGAPISWGVCEVPGWGYQLPVEQVLREMRAVGLSATEFGPDGFLPAPPAERARTLAEAGLAAVGGFVPVVLHDPGADPDRVAAAALDACAAAGARILVLAAATGRDGYDARPALDRAGWSELLATLDRLAALAAARGVTATLHPHVGTMVETADEVDRVLSGCAVPLCLDTGHLLIGGADPAGLARDHHARIAHVHLKDVDADAADRVRAGAVSYTDAVRQGMYRPLGTGDVDVDGIVTSLEAAGYDGWYVLEQDTVLTGPPDDRGPVVDVEASMAYLRTLAPA